MLCDHMWATIVPGNEWLTWLGRLLVFGVISEIPFDLVYGDTVLYPFHQNVMFTLLFGLLAIKALDTAKDLPVSTSRLTSAAIL